MRGPQQPLLWLLILTFTFIIFNTTPHHQAVLTIKLIWCPLPCGAQPSRLLTLRQVGHQRWHPLRRLLSMLLLICPLTLEISGCNPLIASSSLRRCWKFPLCLHRALLQPQVRRTWARTRMPCRVQLGNMVHLNIPTLCCNRAPQPRMQLRWRLRLLLVPACRSQSILQLLPKQ